MIKYLIGWWKIMNLLKSFWIKNIHKIPSILVGIYLLVILAVKIFPSTPILEFPMKASVSHVDYIFPYGMQFCVSCPKGYTPIVSWDSSMDYGEDANAQVNATCRENK